MLFFLQNSLLSASLTQGPRKNPYLALALTNHRVNEYQVITEYQVI